MDVVAASNQYEQWLAGHKRFVPADARINGRGYRLRGGIDKPVAVRYAWANAPAVSLFDTAGLPAAPFRTDDW